MTNKHAPIRKITNRCSIHKYLRFSKLNKTFRTDIYYCVNCPSYTMINSIIGHKSICWKCGNPFTINVSHIPSGNFPLKPICSTCSARKKGKLPSPETETNSLEWLDSSVKSEAQEPNQSKESIVNDLLSLIESK